MQITVCHAWGRLFLQKRGGYSSLPRRGSEGAWWPVAGGPPATPGLSTASSPLLARPHWGPTDAARGQGGRRGEALRRAREAVLPWLGAAGRGARGARGKLAQTENLSRMEKEKCWSE